MKFTMKLYGKILLPQKSEFIIIVTIIISVVHRHRILHLGDWGGKDRRDKMVKGLTEFLSTCLSCCK